MMKLIITKSLWDKTDWPEGEWKSEPDLIIGVDHDTGYTFVIKRHNRGHLCGYVKVPSFHFLYGKNRDKECKYGDYSYSFDFDIHGGITYAENGREFKENIMPDNLDLDSFDFRDEDWWIGFDCSHFQDFVPNSSADKLFFEEQTYRNLAYVQDQVLSLAKQLKKRQELAFLRYEEKMIYGGLYYEYIGNTEKIFKDFCNTYEKMIFLGNTDYNSEEMQSLREIYKKLYQKQYIQCLKRS